MVELDMENSAPQLGAVTVASGRDTTVFVPSESARTSARFLSATVRLERRLNRIAAP
jgi:hypothetical protein